MLTIDLQAAIPGYFTGINDAAAAYAVAAKRLHGEFVNFEIDLAPQTGSTSA